MQPKFQRKKDSSEVFFCQIKRETPLPPEWLPYFFTFPLSRGYAFPPFRRPAAAGERGPPETGGMFAMTWHVHCRRPAAGGIVGAHRQGYAVPTAEGKRGIRHRMVSYPPLNSPSSSLGRDSLRSRVQKRGAHRDVWCSKGTSLMEAELFAAECRRPAPSGRALLCAANRAK